MNPFVLNLLRLVLVTTLPVTAAADWPMLGRDQTRNPVSPEKNPPVNWDIETGRNIKWKAPLGFYIFSDPVIRDGLVWIGLSPPRETAKFQSGAQSIWLRQEKAGDLSPV